MPKYCGAGVTVSLHASPLAANVHNQIVRQRSPEAWRHAETAQKALMDGQKLQEKNVDPSHTGIEMRFLGELDEVMPFKMVYASSALSPGAIATGAHQRGKLATEALASCKETPPSFARNARRTSTNQSNSANLVSFAPSAQFLRVFPNLTASNRKHQLNMTESAEALQALAVKVQVTREAFERRAKATQSRDIKVEVFINGSLADCCLGGKKSYRTASNENGCRVLVISGTRCSIAAEKPLIIVPPGLKADGTLRNPMSSKTNSDPEGWWKKIGEALLEHAKHRGTDTSGRKPLSARYLEEIAKLRLPEKARELFKPGGQRPGVVDVIITLGKAKKGTIYNTYMCEPAPFVDRRFQTAHDCLLLSSILPTQNPVTERDGSGIPQYDGPGTHPSCQPRSTSPVTHPVAFRGSSPLQFPQIHRPAMDIETTASTTDLSNLPLQQAHGNGFDYQSSIQQSSRLFGDSVLAPGNLYSPYRDPMYQPHLYPPVDRSDLQQLSGHQAFTMSDFVENGPGNFNASAFNMQNFSNDLNDDMPGVYTSSGDLMPPGTLPNQPMSTSTGQWDFSFTNPTSTQASFVTNTCNLDVPDDITSFSTQFPSTHMLDSQHTVPMPGFLDPALVAQSYGVINSSNSHQISTMRLIDPQRSMQGFLGLATGAQIPTASVFDYGQLAAPPHLTTLRESVNDPVRLASEWNANGASRHSETPIANMIPSVQRQLIQYPIERIANITPAEQHQMGFRTNLGTNYPAGTSSSYHHDRLAVGTPVYLQPPSVGLHRSQIPMGGSSPLNNGSTRSRQQNQQIKSSLPLPSCTPIMQNAMLSPAHRTFTSSTFMPGCAAVLANIDSNLATTPENKIQTKTSRRDSMTSASMPRETSATALKSNLIDLVPPPKDPPPVSAPSKQFTTNKKHPSVDPSSNSKFVPGTQKSHDVHKMSKAIQEKSQVKQMTGASQPDEISQHSPSDVIVRTRKAKPMATLASKKIKATQESAVTEPSSDIERSASQLPIKAPRTKPNTAQALEFKLEEDFKTPALCEDSAVTYAVPGPWAEVEQQPKRARRGSSIASSPARAVQLDGHVVRQIKSEKAAEFEEQEILLGVRFVVG